MCFDSIKTFLLDIHRNIDKYASITSDVPEIFRKIASLSFADNMGVTISDYQKIKELQICLRSIDTAPIPDGASQELVDLDKIIKIRAQRLKYPFVDKFIEDLSDTFEPSWSVKKFLENLPATDRFDPSAPAPHTSFDSDPGALLPKAFPSPSKKYLKY